MNNKSTELTRKILLIKLYHCFDHVKKFDDLKTRFNTEIWFRSECRSVKFNDVSRALKFRQITAYTIFSKLRWNFITSELFETKRTEKWIQNEIMIMFNMFDWLIKIEVFENLLTKINMLNHHYVDSSVEFINNVIYFFYKRLCFRILNFICIMLFCERIIDYVYWLFLNLFDIDEMKWLFKSAIYMNHYRI